MFCAHKRTNESSLSQSLFPPILMMIRNSFASFSTSRLKMLPDNYSGSKLDTKKPSVKMSARHHHHLCRLYTTRSRRVFLRIVINARTNRERNWWENQTNRFPTEQHLEIEFLFLSSFMQNNSLSSLRGVKKERKNNKKKPRETRWWKHHSLSLFLPYFFSCFY